MVVLGMSGAVTHHGKVRQGSVAPVWDRIIEDFVLGGEWHLRTSGEPSVWDERAGEVPVEVQWPLRLESHLPC